MLQSIFNPENIFYFLSTFAIFCALMVVTSKNPIHSVLYLVLCFFSISGHYLILNAQFLAIVNIIVYAGAIMVLFLYVIMMNNLQEKIQSSKSSLVKMAAVLSAGLVLLVLVAAVTKTNSGVSTVVNVDTNMGGVKALGHVLFTDYVLPFEITSLLFISAIIGAVYFGITDTKKAN